MNVIINNKSTNQPITISRKEELERIKIKKQCFGDQAIIDAIKRVVEAKSIAEVYIQDLLAAIEHSSYYLRCEDYEDFSLGYMNWLNVANDYVYIHETSMEEVMPRVGYALVTEFFDRETFEENTNITCALKNKQILKSKLNKLNKLELLSFFSIINTYIKRKHMFMTASDRLDMLDEFDEICKRVLQTDSDYYKPLFRDDCDFFDFLDEKTIVNVLCSYINKDIDMAEKVADLLRKESREVAFFYPMLHTNLKRLPDGEF